MIIIIKDSNIKFSIMKEISQPQLIMFAKLSKILAETFDDISRICLSEAGFGDNDYKIIQNNKHSSKKQQWLNKRQQMAGKDNTGDNQQSKYDNGVETFKPPKVKKSKLKQTDGHIDSNGIKQKKGEKRKKIAKWEQEGKPRPPINAFMLFLRDSKFQIMQAKPQLTPSQVSSYASALWNDLTQNQKQKYRNEYRQNKLLYDEQIKQYNEKMKTMIKTSIQNPNLNSNSKTAAEISNMNQAGKGNPKDILDEDVNMEASQNSESMSGI